MIVGGIAFETPVEDPSPAAARAAAKSATCCGATAPTALKPRETVVETYALTFDQSVRGLAVGAAVDFRGVPMGEVTKIDLDYDPARVKFRTVVEIKFYPERLQSRARAQGKKVQDKSDPRQRMQRFVNAASARSCAAPTSSPGSSTWRSISSPTCRPRTSTSASRRPSSRRWRRASPSSRNRSARS